MARRFAMQIGAIHAKILFAMGIANGGVKNRNKGGCKRLFAFVHVCSRLLAFSPLRLLAFVSVCLRLFAFACICLRPPLLRPPLRGSDLRSRSSSAIIFLILRREIRWEIWCPELADFF